MSPAIPIAALAERLVVFGLVLCLSLGVLAACARPPAPTEAAAPLGAIDLAPRCLEVPGLPPLAKEDAPGRLPVLARRVSLPDETTAWLDDAPSSFVRIAVSVPWPREEADDAAIAGLLLSEGWTARDPKVFRDRAARRGAKVRVDTLRDRLWLSIAAPPEDPAAIARLLGELLAFAPMDEAIFAGVRRRARLARLAVSGLPAALARDRLDRLLAGPDAEDPKPAREGEALRATLRARFLENTDRRLFFQGLDADRAAALAAGLPGPRGAATHPDGPVASAARAGDETSAPEPGDVLVVDRSGAPQVEILIAIPNAPSFAEDAALLEALASAVGGNVGGRLFADLRERRGLVYTIDAAQDPEGLFVVTTRARAPRVPAVVAGVEAHLRALVDVPFLPCEAATLAQRMRGEALLEGADAEARYEALRAGLAEPRRIAGDAVTARALPAIDPEALATVARRHLAATPIVILVGDRDAVAHAFEEVAPERRLRGIDAEGRID